MWKIQAKVLRQVSIYYSQRKKLVFKWMFFYRRIDLKDKSDFDMWMECIYPGESAIISLPNWAKVSISTFFFLATPCSMWDLRSSNRDWTRTPPPHLGSVESQLLDCKKGQNIFILKCQWITDLGQQSWYPNQHWYLLSQ